MSAFCNNKLDIWERVADAARGTALSNGALAQRYGVDESIVEEMLEDFSLERCEGCRWWMESYELLDEDGEDTGFCEDCQGNGWLL